MKVTLKSISIIVGLIITVGSVFISTGVFIGSTKSNAVRIEEKITIFAEINKEEHLKIKNSLVKIEDKMDILLDNDREKIEIAKKD